ncbi:MAG: hypothetical protein EA425_17965 [Puniceicoccaceae bacterium]|nr:MAG: hypothetical protein EA425_17965 [Puniceicoccaceae bacterium]
MNKTTTSSKTQRLLQTRRLALGLTLGAALGFAPALSAQFTFKANNTQSLNTADSWVDGVVADADTIAVYDNRVTGPNASPLGGDVGWRGVRILNPGGNVTISGGTLILGSGGIDLSEATADLTIGSTIDFLESQKIKVASGRTLRINNLSRRGAVGLEFEIEPTGNVIYTGITDWLEGGFINAGSQLYAIHNRTDFAALEDNFLNARVLPGMEVVPGSYTPNPGIFPEDPEDPESPLTLPNLPGDAAAFTFLMDFTETSSYGGRAPGNRGVFNLRFNTHNPNFDEWLVDTAAGGRTITVSSVLVTENVGAQNVRLGGPGFIRASNTSGGLQLFQYNTQGDLILSPGGALNAQAGTRTLSKHGPGRVIVDANATYGGATAVFEGVLQFNRIVASPNHGMTVHNGAEIHLSGATLTIAGMNVLSGGSLTGRGSITGNVTNDGEIVIAGSAGRLQVAGDFVNNGTLRIQNGAFLEVEGTFVNNGTFDYSGSYAVLPEGWENNGTVVPGIDGEPPPVAIDVLISSLVRDGDQVLMTVPSVEGYAYRVERSNTPGVPTIMHTRVTTADGNGADADVGTDTIRDPDTNYGANGTMNLRNFFGTRQQIAVIRFDISELDEDHLLDEATISVFFPLANRTRDFAFYGVTDETLDNWIESGEGGITYNNFGAFQPAGFGEVNFNTAAVTQLGVMSLGNMGSGVTYTTDPDLVPLGDFLRGSSNELVTIVIVVDTNHQDGEFSIATKENANLGQVDAFSGDTIIPPTLVVPTLESFADHQLNDPYVAIGPPQSGTGEDLTFTDEIGEAIRGFWRVVAERD